MKPIKLTVQAFGPFAEREVIDFTLLGSAPLFLINGPTGSGKSTILDAICFALYGETTGSERTGDQMRCDHAKAELMTEVIFEFALGEKHYRIERSPEQQIPKKRGEGTTKRTHSATLFCIDHQDEELIANKPTPVAKAIVELIGLDVKQFRQVMVLPQGKFRELLIANSKEREQIFGQLFATHIYVAIERALFDRAAGIRKAKDEFDNQIKGVLDVVNVDSEEALHALHQQQLPQCELAEKELVKTQKELEQAQANEKQAVELISKFDNLEQMLAQQTTHLAQHEAHAQNKVQRENASAAIALNVAHARLQQTNQEAKHVSEQVCKTKVTLEAATQQLEVSNNAWLHAAEQAKQVPELNQQLYTLKEISGKFAELAKSEQMVAKSNQHISQLSTEKSALDRTHQSLEKSLTEKRSEFESVKDAYATIPLKQQQLDAINSQLTLVVQKAETETALEKQQLLLKQLEQEQMQAQHLVAKAKETADRIEFHWHSTQAAQLAKRLELGEPCPVCGSCEHPNPARFTSEEVTKKDVEQARLEQQKHQEQLDTVSARVQKGMLVVAKTQQSLDSILLQLGERAIEKKEQVAAQLSILDNELAQLRRLDPEQTSQQLVQLESQFTKVKSELDEKTQQLNDANVLLARQLAEVDTYSKGIPAQYQKQEEVTVAIAQTEHLVKQYLDTEQTTKAHAEQGKQKTIELQATCDELSKQLNRTQTEVEEAQRLWLEALSSSPFADEQAYLAAKLDPQTLALLDVEIQTYDEKSASLRGSIETLQKTLEGASKPEVEMLSQVREQANIAHQQALNAYSEAKSVLDRIQEVQKRLVALYAQNEALEKEYQVIGTLSDIANGKTGAKVSLHRFVLGVLLDDVLIQASQRLRIMSKGRYELRRKEERAKGNAGSGLDLMVEDGYTGKLRDVATLSGGESFMAALSLALGLSDVVQSYSGGIRLDTLFIDEGFGSLDPESLDLAIQTLIDLQQGGRTIGVISHVSELKEQMSLRVDIEASRVGSRVKVVS
ncbi:AAA family ATPase [Vibrio sp. NTOU-M3]|uniref:AAA family ATPase n=1 Tax=Vibrio sp. NTOU-M3 TaxID=3234954 RepID=UPI00349F9E7C